MSKVSINPVNNIFEYLNSEKNNLYSDHQLIWSLFPDRPDGERNFLYRKEIKFNNTVYYLVSKEKPCSSHSFLNLETKEYKPVIKKGEHYSFFLRANPVVAKKAVGKKNSKKYDIWMNARVEGQARGLKDGELIKFIDVKTKEWLTMRTPQYGFFIQEEYLIIDNYQQHSFYKKKNKQGSIKIASIDYYGILEVKDEDLFVNTLSSGIGKSRSFGCGLLMIKRL